MRSLYVEETRQTMTKMSGRQNFVQNFVQRHKRAKL